MAEKNSMISRAFVKSLDILSILASYALITFGLMLLSTLVKSPWGQALAANNEIVVSAAISLKDAFQEIRGIYEARTGTRINFNFGASGILQKQIEGGAPVDVFASAGEKQMDELDASGLIVRETRSDFARNLLVLVVPIDSQLKIDSFEDFKCPQIKRIAIGNPKTVPAGQYAKQLLANMKLWNELQPKLILAENVRQVLDYVLREEVEAGIIYASDAISAGSKVKTSAQAPERLHDPIHYTIAVIKESQEKEAANQLVNIVLSSEGQLILSKHGFLNLK
jgi:molybdate transport system substrate-binding protein